MFNSDELVAAATLAAALDQLGECDLELESNQLVVGDRDDDGRFRPLGTIVKDQGEWRLKTEKPNDDNFRSAASDSDKCDSVASQPVGAAAAVDASEIPFVA